MNKLQEIINSIKEKMPNNLTELEQARFTYIELGKVLTFNPDYDFGSNSDMREEYRKSKIIADNANRDLETSLDEIEKKFEQNKMICIEISYLYKYALDNLGISSQVIIDFTDEYMHWANIIKLKDNSTIFADLQVDLMSIHTGAKTTCFGVIDITANSSISTDELLEIDKNIGYIPDFSEHSEEFYYDYSDNYLSKMKLAISEVDIQDKADFVFKYGNTYTNLSHAGISEMYKYYKFLNAKLLNNKLTHTICYYKNDENKKEYVSCFSLDQAAGPRYYIFSDTKDLPIFSDEIIKRFETYRNSYISVTPEEFDELIKNGLKVNFAKSVPGLTAYFRNKARNNNINEIRD